MFSDVDPHGAPVVVYHPGSSPLELYVTVNFVLQSKKSSRKLFFSNIYFLQRDSGLFDESMMNVSVVETKVAKKIARTKTGGRGNGRGRGKKK